MVSYFYCYIGFTLFFISSNEEEQIPQENLFAERNIEEKPEEASEEDPPVTVMLVDVKVRLRIQVCMKRMTENE